MTAESPAAGDDFRRRRTIAFINWAHSIDHYVILIFTTVAVGSEAIFGRSYGEVIALGTPSFVAFGLFSLPAGWLADRWSRRNMMVAFYVGCGLSLIAAAMAPNVIVLAVALFALGVFAAIYHPVGMAILVDVSQARGRTLAFNGVCGNLGVSFAAGITAALVSSLGWHFAFLVPGAICVATGVAYYFLEADDRHKTGVRKTAADVSFSAKLAIAIFSIYVIISICGGLTFNTITVALPKIVDERAGQDVSLLAVGGLTSAVFMCGAVAQLVIGRLVERFPPYILFVFVVILQFTGVLWAASATGAPLIAALALTMAAIYAQVTIGDIVVARYTADAWRGRIYAVRFFLTFLSSGVAVSIIAYLYARGGFDLVLATTAAITGVLVVSVISFAALVFTGESKHKVPQPAE